MLDRSAEDNLVCFQEIKDGGLTVADATQLLSLSLSNRTGGEHKKKKLVGQDEDKITYKLPSCAKQPQLGEYPFNLLPIKIELNEENHRTIESFGLERTFKAGSEKSSVSLGVVKTEIWHFHVTFAHVQILPGFLYLFVQYIFTLWMWNSIS